MSITRVNPTTLVADSGDGNPWGVKDTRIDQNGSAPSSNRWSKVFQAYDKDGDYIAYLLAGHKTNGNIVAELSASRTVNNARKYSGIAAELTPSGGVQYSVTDPAAFRGALQMTLGYGSVTCAANKGTSAKIPFKDTTRTNTNYLAFAQFSSNPSHWTELRGPVITGRDADGVTVTIWNTHTAAVTVGVWVVAIG
jgi:hypothetical protein